MPSVEPQILYKDFENAKFSPLYFLTGEEPYLIQQCLDRFKACLLSEIDYDFNFSSFYAADADVEKVKDAVETLPMMKDRRLVFLKEAQDLNEKEWEALESLFVTPVDSTIFVISASKVDKRKKALKLLMEKSISVEFKKPFENQIPSWIKYIATTKEVSINDEAIHLIHKLVGNNLTEIDSQLRKLSDYVLPKKNITSEDVKAVVSFSKEENIFDFTKAVGKRDRVQALEQLVHLLDQGQSEIGIVSLLARHVRILLFVKKGMEQNLSGAKLSHFAQVSNYFLDGYVQQARVWNVPQLHHFLVLLSETDRALKSSPISSHIWLESLVMNACNLNRAADSSLHNKMSKNLM